MMIQDTADKERVTEQREAERVGLKEMVKDFILESRNLVEGAAQELRNGRGDDPEALNRIFRGIHTVKGTAGFLGFGTLSAIGGLVEEILLKMRKGDLAADGEVEATLLAGCDAMASLVEEIAAAGTDTRRDVSAIVGSLEEIKGRTQGGNQVMQSSVPNPETVESPERVQAGLPEADGLDGKTPVIPAGTVRGVNTVPLEVATLDRLKTLADELVAVKNRIRTVAKDREGTPNREWAFQADLDDAVSRLEMTATELLDTITRARSMTVRRLADALEALIRDACPKQDHLLEIAADCGEREVDVALFEAFQAPFLSLIRYLEPATRLCVTIVPEGETHLALEVSLVPRGQGHQGGETRDAGRARRLMAECVALMQEGIGRLKGSVGMDDTGADGIRLTVTLPIIPEKMPVLLVSVGGEEFALPSASITEVVKYAKNRIKSMDGGDVFSFRDRVVPLINLDGMLRLHGSPAGDAWIVVCEVSGKVIGLKVDSALRHQTVTVRPLGELLSRVEWACGVTFGEEGRIIPVLHAARILEGWRNRGPAAA